MLRKAIAITAFLMLVTALHDELSANRIEEATSEHKTIQTPLMNAEGKTIGKAVIMQAANGVLIHLEASGLPHGWHALHVHQYGVCEAPSFDSAGGHFNPTKREHGYDNPKGYHAGDLPNVYADKNGSVRVEFFTDQLTLVKSRPNSLLKEGGTALIIHEGADDYQTDPAGGAGKRLACGVISQDA